MTQDELLDRVWREVIDTAPVVGSLGPATSLATLDVEHVARLARYEAIFEWCVAFDESERPVSEWLSLSATDEKWTRLAARPASAFRRPPGRPNDDAPFTDAIHAQIRLHDAGVEAAALAGFCSRQGHVALARLRVLLSACAFDHDDLVGLHESLLSADPSGHEARPGSWPARARGERPSMHGPLVTLAKSHALALDPSGNRVVAAKGGAVTEIATSRVIATLALLANTSHVAWSPCGRWIAASSTSGSVAICNAETGVRAHVLKRSYEGPAPVFAEDGQTLFGADWKGLVRAWDVTSGKPLREHDEGSRMISELEMLSSDQFLGLVHTRPTPTELVLFTASLDVAWRRPLEASADTLAVDRVRRRAWVLGRGSLTEVDLASGEVVCRHRCDARRIAVAPDGRWLGLVVADGFRVGPIEDLAAAVALPRRYASNVCFSRDSARIALSTWNAGEVWAVERLVRSPLE